MPIASLPRASRLPLTRLSRAACALLVAFATLATFTATPALAQSAVASATGTITGTVGDKTTKTFLPGAEVRLAGSALTTAAGRDGSFTLSNVPAGQHTLE